MSALRFVPCPSSWWTRSKPRARTIHRFLRALSLQLQFERCFSSTSRLTLYRFLPRFSRVSIRIHEKKTEKSQIIYLKLYKQKKNKKDGPIEPDFSLDIYSLFCPNQILLGRFRLMGVAEMLPEIKRLWKALAMLMSSICTDFKGQKVEIHLRNCGIIPPA